MADMKPRGTKAPLALLPRLGLEAAAAAMEHGAGKYWPNNWQDCPADEIPTYYHAMMRHVVALASGETHDPESGVHHLAHIAAGAMISCHILGIGYVEPQVMRDHPDRKQRITSAAAIYGPRPESLPTSPAAAKEQAITPAREFAVPVTARTDDEGTISIDAPGFTTVRVCQGDGCGLLVAGGPTMCLACARRAP